MANPWFRLYSEFMHDPKVQVLTEALQRRYVMLLCMQCADYLEKRPDDEIALSLRVTEEDWRVTKDEFVKRGLLLPSGKINGWEKRQFISDIKDPTAAERQKRYRENKRNARNDNVTSRPPEADTEQKQNKPLSAKPDVIEVIEYLNLKAGRNYKTVEANSKFVLSRLNEGATIDDMKRVIDKKVLEWGNDATMNKYLRPATLFNAEKFAQYSGETAKTQKPGKLNMEEWLKNV